MLCGRISCISESLLIWLSRGLCVRSFTHKKPTVGFSYFCLKSIGLSVTLRRTWTANLSTTRLQFGTVFWALRQGLVWFEQTCKFSGIQFTKHFIELLLWKRTDCLVLMIQTWSLCGKPAARASARAWLRVAKAECWHYICLYKYDIPYM